MIKESSCNRRFAASVHTLALAAHDLFGKPVPIPDQAEDMLFGITHYFVGPRGVGAETAIGKPAVSAAE
jgi:hypothetical protein